MGEQALYSNSTTISSQADERFGYPPATESGKLSQYAAVAVAQGNVND